MSLLDGFVSRCKTHPKHIALVQDERSLSYIELHATACRIASYLGQKRIRSAAQIAIALDRGIDATAAILAVLYSGCCYIPLDIDNPDSRLRFIINDAQAKVIIGHGNCPEWVDNKSLWLNLDELDDDRVEFEMRRSSAEDLSAILYTSGSTGTPKGVALSCRAMLAFANWAGQTFKIRASDQVASLAPFFFDLSVFDVFTSLNYGATVNFVPSGLTMSPSRLSAWLKENRISIWYTVPSLLCFLALKGNLGQTSLPDLRCILFAGEVFPSPQLIKLLELLPNVKLFNLYGPTETNVCCYWPVDGSRLRSQQSIPIGIPACQAQLRIDQKQGELLVKGPTLFSGYWNTGKLDNMVCQEGWYRTGDRVSLNDRGEYVYNGRLDRMLKCSGYRVEPAEIETVINSIPGVIQSAVIGINDAAGGHRLAAAVASPSDQKSAQMNLAIRARLPRYMWPSRVTIVARLPVVANGKIDYASVEKLFQVNPKTPT